MEWVETTGKSVEEAKELALDQLGVDASEAEFELIEEPKSGLFGRTRGAARVRARVAPLAPPPKNDRRRKQRKPDAGSKGRGGSSGRGSSADNQDQGNTADATEEAPKAVRPKGGDRGDRGDRGGRSGGPKGGGRQNANRQDREPMDSDEQVSTLEEFLVGLLSSFGLEGTVSATLVDNELRANIAGEGLGLLVGSRLATLDSIQDVARHALQRQAAGREYAKVIVDVDDVRIRRRDALSEFVQEAATTVREGDSEVVFEVMSSVDRKQVHDLVGELDGVVSSSEGEDPRRRVVLKKG